MTHYTFTQMPIDFQLIWVLGKGTYLARRWQEDGAVNLYYIPDEGRGFFVEVGYDAYCAGTMVLGSFSSSVLLENYTHGVRLPKLW